MSSEATGVRAIPTNALGQQFRSRLEARVALLLEHFSISWEYEAEGYELSTGERYLPDFWLPEINTYIEVKGPHGEREHKPRQFALDLTGEADDRFHDDEWLYPTTMVLIAHSDKDFLGAGQRMYSINALGASVVCCRCHKCKRVQWVNIGGFRCRSCAAEMDWEAHYSDDWHVRTPLPQLPQWRPVG